MLPCRTVEYPLDNAVRHRKHFVKALMSYAFLMMQSTDFDNFGIRQLVRRSILATFILPTSSPKSLERLRLRFHAAFGKCVKGIIFFCAKPKMFGIKTSGLVSSRAIMKHEQAVWNISKFEQPRHAMCVHWFSSNSNRAISRRSETSFPQPTGWCLEHEPPKSCKFFFVEVARVAKKGLLWACGLEKSIGRHNVCLSDSDVVISGAQSVTGRLSAATIANCGI